MEASVNHEKGVAMYNVTNLSAITGVRAAPQNDSPR